MKEQLLLKRMSIPGLLVCLILSLTNCKQPLDKPIQFNIEEAQIEIESRLRDYENAMVDGDKDAFANLYAIDAEIFHDGSHSTIGRENIVKNFEGWIRDSVIGGFETTGLWGNEHMLVEQGMGYFAHAGGKWKGTGKYLLVWKKVDGQWQIFKDTWFSDPKPEE